MCRSVVIVAALLAPSGHVQPAKRRTAVVPREGIPVVAVCEVLKDLVKFNGKQIIVVGRLGATDEGSWLMGDCESKLVTQGYTWANLISTTYARPQVPASPRLPDGFQWDEMLLTAKLRASQKAGRRKDWARLSGGDRWVAIFGRLETRVPLQTAIGGGGKLMGYGFGHLNAAPAQLIAADDCVHELRVK